MSLPISFINFGDAIFGNTKSKTWVIEWNENIGYWNFSALYVPLHPLPQ